MPPTATILTYAHWGDAFGAVLSFLDADDDQVDTIEEAEAVEWICLDGAIEDHVYVIDLALAEEGRLTFTPIH